MIKFEKISKDQFFDDCRGLRYDDIKMPKRSTSGSAGYDFFCLQDISLNPGEEILVPTGIKAMFPKYVVLLLYPRSGHGFKFFLRLANTVGVIDSDYYNCDANEGHIMIKLRNEGNKPFVVAKGTAIAQGIFTPYLVTDEDLYSDENINRTGGFGSTDNKIETYSTDGVSRSE